MQDDLAAQSHMLIVFLSATRQEEGCSKGDYHRIIERS
jgi:hypothetical protein